MRKRQPLSSPRERIFVTGTTGYIGGRLVPRLLRRDADVIAFGRSIEKLRARSWASHPSVRLVAGDVSDERRLVETMEGATAAYYLVHSMMAAGRDYAEVDRRLARTFARAAERASVSRILYLGGLGETGAGLSEHLSSRREVESALASTSVPVTTLRAAMIIGAGSASFEILRYLVERLPVMVTPKWVRTECQPVAVEDVLEMLVSVLDHPETMGDAFDIGGSDVATYQEIMRTTAEVLGLPRRLILPVPVLTPRLSSLWIHLVTPVSREIARPLAEGLRNRVVCRDDRLARLTGHRFLGIREAIEAAVRSVREKRVESAWSDAGVIPGDPDWAGGTTYRDVREIDLDAAPSVVFRAVSRIGGDRGYYAADWLWWLRGVLDRVVGGPGLRRGRRDPEHLVYGDAVDFWRVTRVIADREIELRAEMKLPGEALLRFEVVPLADNRTRLTQTARFRPRGLLGMLYWYSVLPLHAIVFARMLRGIGAAAEESGAGSSGRLTLFASDSDPVVGSHGGSTTGGGESREDRLPRFLVSLVSFALALACACSREAHVPR